MKKRLKSSHHALDQWPPVDKKPDIEKATDLKNKPRNVSYKDPDEYLIHTEGPIYDSENKETEIKDDQTNETEKDENADNEK